MARVVRETRTITVEHVDGSPFPQGYRSDTVDPWPVREARDVPVAIADYLTSTFPQAFVVRAAVEPPAPAVPPVDPPVDPPAPAVDPAAPPVPTKE